MRCNNVQYDIDLKLNTFHKHHLKLIWHEESMDFNQLLKSFSAPAFPPYFAPLVDGAGVCRLWLLLYPNSINFTAGKFQP